MLGNHKIVLDYFCEIDNLISSYADERFFDLTDHNVVPGAIYIVGRNQLRLHSEKLHHWANQNIIKGVVLCNPAEGSETILWIYRQNKLEQLGIKNKAAVITGGDLPQDIPHLLFEHFATLIHDYKENIAAIEKYQHNYRTDRPYKFLFLNGRPRAHRVYLLKKFQMSGLLDQALWSNLNSGPVYTTDIKFDYNGKDLLLEPFPVHYLPPEYEVSRYRAAARSLQEVGSSELYVQEPTLGSSGRPVFGKEWGEIYLESKPYEDTYFSLVAETIFDYHCSFRTEKIWKPIAIGHPWIAVTNAGFYRDMHNLGFRTFGHLIDESFDQIDNNQQRIERIAQVVEDLCQQDLASFLTECVSICKYNQQLHIELASTARQAFPNRFYNFINERFRF
jgi:hypothetical protein